LTAYGERATLGSKTFWFSQLQVLLTLGALLSFVFLLYGYFNRLLLIALLCAAEVGATLAQLTTKEEMKKVAKEWAVYIK